MDLHAQSHAEIERWETKKIRKQKKNGSAGETPPGRFFGDAWGFRDFPAAKGSDMYGLRGRQEVVSFFVRLPATAEIGAGSFSEMVLRIALNA